MKSISPFVRPASSFQKREGQVFAAFTLLLFLFVSPCAGLAAVFDGTDDFNDNAKNSALWDNDVNVGIGRLTETNSHIHYSTAAGTPMNGDYSGRPWKQQISATNDWEIRVVSNVPDISLIDSQHYAFGLFVLRNGDTANQQVLMLSNESPNYTPGRSFYAISSTNSLFHYEGEITTSARSAQLRMRWDSSSFQLSSQFSTDAGKTWTNCGAPVTNPWGVAAGDHFVVGPAGYSENLAVSLTDNVYGDNFQTVGQKPVITSVQKTGTLTLSDSLTNAFYTIEWASTINGPWYRSWSNLTFFLSTNTSTTVRVPVFYRAVRE